MSPEEVIVIRKLAKRGNMNDRMDVVLNKFRSRINSYPPGMCPLVMYRSILQMSMNQSCGKCVPCRDGLVEVDRLLGSILNGDATEETIPKMRKLCEMIASVTPSYGGISFGRLDAGESLQWPCPTKDHPGTPIMHVNGPVRGKALLYPAAYRPAAELPDEDYPLLLTTGRILAQYNAGSMTLREPGIMEIAGEGFVEIHPADAERLGIEHGERVAVFNRRGSITATAHVGGKVSEGEVWMPFHFPDSPVNFLTNAALDEFASIPEYKVCAVKIGKL